MGPVTRVNINGEGHQVEVQHEGADLIYVIEKAQKLWTETLHESGKDVARPMGFAAEKREVTP